MKKIVVLILLFLPIITFAQSTEILPGTVLPQMTTAQRTGIAAPVNGMLVFDTTTQSYWYQEGGVWEELLKNYWQLNGLEGNEIKNTNEGGFWSANPVGLALHLDFKRGSTNITNPPTSPINGDGTRLMWIPNRSAFRVGTIGDNSKSWDADSIGLFSFATGYNSKAKGYYSTAMGISSEATGISSIALGRSVKAIDNYSIAMGYSTQASGFNATAFGNDTRADGAVSTAMGIDTEAIGDYSTAMGRETEASGDISTAMGDSTTANGLASTAIGKKTLATGDYSTAMGYNTKASGSSSTAMGYETEAIGNYATAIGWLSTANSGASTAIGYENETTAAYATAIGNHTTSSGFASIAIGTRISTDGFQGSFVISDYITDGEASGGDSLFATAEDQFSARFENGYRLYTDNDLSDATKYGVFLNNKSNSWSSLSDSTKKERFLTYDPKKVLSSVAAMRVGTWNYKGDRRPEGRHWGVMAQDFYQHFGKDDLGTIGSDTLIATADFDGVSFAAIQALELRTRALQEENEKLKKALALKDDEYLKLFAELKAEIVEMKLTKNSAGKSESK